MLTPDPCWEKKRKEATPRNSSSSAVKNPKKKRKRKNTEDEPKRTEPKRKKKKPADTVRSAKEEENLSQLAPAKPPKGWWGFQIILSPTQFWHPHQVVFGNLVGVLCINV